jgi:uncharacterized cupin superfamily protein
MPKIDLDGVPGKTGSGYPIADLSPFDGRVQQRIGDAAGLTQFGVNRVVLKPGALSSLRHWHERQDEFLVVTEGTCTLIDDHGETTLHPGDCAAFPAGDANGHQIANHTGADAAFIVVGTRTETETAWYSDLDMKVTSRDGSFHFTRKDGSPLE